MKLLLAGLLLQQTVLATAALNCQNGYVPYDNRDGYCVKAYQAKLTRNAAAAQCLADGGYLIDVVNAFSNAEVLGLGNTAQQWLGVQCTVDGDGTKCTHDDPSNNKYTNFAPGGFPLTTAPFGQCVYMVGSGNAAGKWYSDGCDDDLKPFACEYQPQAAAGCGAAYSQFGGACYRVLPTAMTEADAEQTCVNDCGYLTSVLSAEENNYILQISQQVQNTVLYTRIGLMFNGLSYYWRDGTKFNSAVYQNFGHIDTTLGDCVGMSLVNDAVNAGEWINTNCSRPTPGVCKKALNSPCIPVTVPPTSATCDKTQYVNANQTIYSPGYPNSYGAVGRCEYIVSVPRGYVAAIYFEYFNIDAHSYIYLYDDLEDDQPFQILNSSSIVPQNTYFYSTENQMKIYFYSNNGAGCINPANCISKWIIHTVAEVPNGNLCDSSICNGLNSQQIPAPGNIISPNYPNNYPNFYCGTYLLYTDSHKRIQLTFNYFNTEKDFDLVYIYDGCNELAPLITKPSFNGSLTTPFNAPISSSNYLFVVFETSPGTNYKGFSGSFISVV